MHKTEDFKCIKHAEIDRGKWNACIKAALNSRVYAYDWYLDRSAETWNALVWGDYEYIMPLPVGKKVGISYLYQPMYSQQLGIFPSPPQKVAVAFYTYIYAHFRYSDMQLNADNLPELSIGSINFVERKNYLLPLSESYEEIAASYSSNTMRNIAKAGKQQFTLVEGIRLETYLDFASKHAATHDVNKTLPLLKTLIACGQRKSIGLIYGAYNNQNELCAAAYLCRNKERLIYLSAATSEVGKETGGMFFLVNECVKRYAGKNMWLDFEGSMLPGVERFYKGFGAKAESYFQLKFNRLPLPLRWLKR